MAFTANEASSSSHPSSSPPQSWSYHVFLSFRGEDTRKGFTDHLYAALERKGITTFKDDKDLERGEVISQELLKAIEESMFAITVLSPNYASSSWCLDELQKIIDCKNKLGLSIVPIFYGVEPANVRYQRGTFAKAFRKHEERFGQDSHKVQRWRDALRQVACHSGWDSKNQHEAALVESIAEHIHKKLIPKLPSCMENLVGMASRVEQVYSLLGMGLNDVRFVGIWGMGGIGKTTIARAVYEATQAEFQVSCHLANVREVSETTGLVQLQKDLVSHLDISRNSFHNLFDGRNTLRNSLCRKKVLLILDDVSDVSQLENLAEKQEWFGPGSRVLITTRDLHLLKVHEVHGIYEVKGLVTNEAHRLFCLKAFKQNQPKAEYLELSKEVVQYTYGLPLALEVQGSYLYGRSVDVWRSALNKIKSVPHAKILDTLRISYDSLDSVQKHIFLDIACFFKGRERDEVLDFLDKCGYNPRIEIDILIERSLIKVTQDPIGNYWLEMHDLLQEMGRNIVFQESPNDPSKRSRLWSQKDIDFVLTNDKGTEAIQAIVLNFGNKDPRSADASSVYKALSLTSQLKLLSLYGMKMELSLDLNCLPRSLKVLHWPYNTLKTLLHTDKQNEVFEYKSKPSEFQQCWKGKKFLDNLVYLNLSFSKVLKGTPDLSAVPSLETLDLQHCSSLTEVHSSLVRHKNLVRLNLEGCISLKTLPDKLEMSSLEVLILSHCDKFKKLPEFGKCMIHLSKLLLDRTCIRELPRSLGCLVSLSYLNLSRCFNFVWVTDDTFHECSCTFPNSVTELDLSGNKFDRVPYNIHKLPKLRCIKLNYCSNLQVLPELPSSTIELQARNCSPFYTPKFNPLSKICNFLTSPRKDIREVFKIQISDRKIPSWFVHREFGNSIVVPQDCPPLNEMKGIAFCFLLQGSPRPQISDFIPQPPIKLHFVNGNSFITETILTSRTIDIELHFYILYLTSDQISDEIDQRNCFKLLIHPSFLNQSLRVGRCSARWVCQQDIEDLRKMQ